MIENPKSNTSLALICILTDILVVNYNLDIQYIHFLIQEVYCFIMKLVMPS